MLYLEIPLKDFSEDSFTMQRSIRLPLIKLAWFLPSQFLTLLGVDIFAITERATKKKTSKERDRDGQRPGKRETRN